MSRNHSLRAFAFAMALFLGGQNLALAQSPMALQVSASSSDTAPLALGLADLDAMQQVSFTTTTVWTDGAVTFSGVPLKAVLAQANAQGSTVEMIALNDYKVAMPWAEIDDSAPIIATRMDGKTMSVRDKGPYWVVFPYDQDPKYQTETIYSFSIWQLNQLNFVE